jgi:hypothetical protein
MCGIVSWSSRRLPLLVSDLLLQIRHQLTLVARLALGLDDAKLLGLTRQANYLAAAVDADGLRETRRWRRGNP